jgi:hypothetical protein
MRLEYGQKILGSLGRVIKVGLAKRSIASAKFEGAGPIL